MIFIAALLACVAIRSHAAASEETTERAHFTVTEYRVIGNTVLHRQDIERTLYGRLGPDKSIEDVEQARAALEIFYHDRGYATVFVDIPEQDVAEGVVRLKVTEGKLERVHLTGARYFSRRILRAEVPEATDFSVPHIPTLQAQLGEVNNQSPDRTVTPVLKAGSQPGAVNLALKVEDKLPVHGSLALNDQYAPDTSRLRSQATLSYDDMFGRLDSLSLQYQTSPQDTREVDVKAASYTARLTSAGTKFAAFFVDSNSNIATAGTGQGAITILGKGKIYGLRLVDPLEASAAATHVFVGGVEYKDFTESVFSKDTLLTPISYVNLSAGHVSVWRGTSMQLSLTDTLAFGIRGPTNTVEEFRVKRNEGIPNYFLWRGDASLSLMLPASLNLRLRAGGQFSVDSIISNEQYSIAGADGVRGYLEAEELGDSAIKSSLELASQRWQWFGGRFGFDTFAFFDYGRVSRANPLRETIDPNSPTYGYLLEPVNSTLRSAGVGLNFTAFEHVAGNLAWAYPLVDSANASGTQRGDSRIHFNIQTAW